MKRTIFSLLAATTLAAGLPAAAIAQSEITVNQRQADLDARIDAGVRSRSLTNAEAAQLRSAPSFRTSPASKRNIVRADAG
ncbi:MAG: hypothetical protein ACOYM8_17235 [Caulobacterales bacterium]|jgi:hypothetical protein